MSEYTVFLQYYKILYLFLFASHYFAISLFVIKVIRVIRGKNFNIPTFLHSNIDTLTH